MIKYSLSTFILPGLPCFVVAWSQTVTNVGARPNRQNIEHYDLVGCVYFVTVFFFVIGCQSAGVLSSLVSAVGLGLLGLSSRFDWRLLGESL